LKTSLKLIFVAAAICVLIGIAVRPLIFKSEETGPVYAEAVSEDGLLKLTMVLEKTKFTTNPREPVKINLTLTNIGSQDITITFHYKTKFDFMIWDYSQAWYVYRWSFDHIEGPPNWAADPSTYPTNETLDPPDVNMVTLRPGEGITQLFFWNQQYSGGGEVSDDYPQVALAPKGRYRIEGAAGLSRFPAGPDNPLRYLEYTASDGTLISTVIQAPGTDITLI